MDSSTQQGIVLANIGGTVGQHGLHIARGGCRREARTCIRTGKPSGNARQKAASQKPTQLVSEPTGGYRSKQFLEVTCQRCAHNVQLYQPYTVSVVFSVRLSLYASVRM